MMNKKRPTTVAAYITAAPAQARPLLRQLRRTIRAAVPEAREWMSYGIPAYEYRVPGYNGRLIYFAAFAKHLSVYPATSGLQRVPALKKFQVSVGTLQFSYDEPLPLGLLTRFIKARKRELNQVQEQKTEMKRSSRLGRSRPGL